MSVSNIKKMGKKILVVFHDNDINSGASKSFLSNVLYLKKQNYSIDALIPKKKGDLKKELRKNGINIFCVSYGGAVYSTNKHLLNAFKSYLRCFLKLIISYISIYFFYSQNKHNNYTCIYSNTSTIYVGAWLSKLYKAKHIWHFREFGYEDQNSKRIFNFLFKKYINNAFKIITISKILNNYYIKKFNISNSICLYNDINKSYICPNKISHSEFNILITGTLCESKGQLYAIKAVEKLKDNNVHLYIAGRKNSYYKFLEHYVKEHNVHNVHFLDMVSNMNEIRSKIDISLVCAKKEAFGRTIVEDMLAKILVIGCDTGAIPELIENNSTGYIYEYGNLNDLVHKIQYAQKNVEERAIIVDRAFDNAIRNFTNQNTAKKIQELID